MTAAAVKTRRVVMNRLTWLRFVRAVRNFAASEVGGRAGFMFFLLVALLLGVNGMNVVNSYVGRDFMTAVEQRDIAGFVWQATVYVSVFAVLTAMAGLLRFTEERLALLWRGWLTRRLVTIYLDRRVYYRLRENSEVENPDQRITEDVRTFTTVTLSFVLMFLNGGFTIVAFSGVMWTISPLLFVVAVGYALLGSGLTIALGRPLIWLNYNQADREARFRADLVHLGEHAESVLLLNREARLQTRLARRIDELLQNARRITVINRNLAFFSNGYNYLIQVIPILIVAPLFIRGEAEFGVISQSAMAFSHLLGAFSLIVTQFQQISSFAAVNARLSALAEGTERLDEVAPHAIRVTDDNAVVAYENLDLCSPVDGHVLVRSLSLSIPHGTRVLVRGPNEAAKLALFKATAGIWDQGSGSITRPLADEIFFLPERSYLPHGTLREVILSSDDEATLGNERIESALGLLGLEGLLRRVGGLDVEREWDDILSLGEQHLLLVARLLVVQPRFVFIDRLSTALEPHERDKVLQLLTEHSVSYVAFARSEEPLEWYDAVLELMGDGTWIWTPLDHCTPSG